jgi:hypothetical protein
MKKSKFTESQIRLNPGYFHVLMCFLLSARQIDQVHFNLSYQTLRPSLVLIPIPLKNPGI